MEAAKKFYMNGSSSTGSYLVLGRKSGIGLGYRVYFLGISGNAAGLVLFTRVRLRSEHFDLPVQDEETPTEDQKIVSLKRVKEKASADHRTIWGDLSWQKSNDTYASVFADSKLSIGSQADIAAFVAAHPAEALAKTTAEYLLSLVPEENRIVTVEDVASEFLPGYTDIIKKLVTMQAYADAEQAVDQEMGGAFHLQTDVLKKMKDELKAKGVWEEDPSDVADKDPTDGEDTTD